ncbi:NUDIX hydrolase [Trueperella bialowiezensis]|uniref:RNA pyrophosphohydrolase n=1 Tax=Trueperella bialowiezensis TaxID=312285 RepID=A0A3S4WF43_9ACTO|nr:NUDIX domain-containing protein [Trueperella bialowiezensis]VEI12484.1 RNA pyrophosphohydrolase [Trueperella bialowiezensis]
MEHEWPLDADGFPHRQAGRCVVFNPAGQLLLILGHDVDDPDYRWWFTPGGGLDDGESAREGAARELREETGLAVAPARLVGPVLDRRSTFRFLRKTRKQDELYFIVHVDDAEQAVIDSRAEAKLTAQEQSLLDEFRWWDLGELAAVAHAGELVFPVGLAAMATVWRDGWDGTVITRVEE